jgi:pyruvate-ferredoxin/flavodoxin oxidoreductase
MRELTAVARRLARRLIAGPTPSEPSHPGVAEALSTLVALRRAELEIVGRDHSALLQGVDGLSEAIGRAAVGQRATVFLSASQVVAARSLLSAAATRRLPLVAHVVGGRKADVVGTGAVVLAAANAQEAVDLALAGRRLAERALAPVVVLMDRLTAGGVEEILLPPVGLIRELLGEAGDEVASPTAAQEALFGHRRRRLPRWHDPERPLRLGARRGVELEAPANAAAEILFTAHLPELLAEALEALVGATGRRIEAVGGYRVADAELLLVAWGAAVETAESVADALRSRHRLPVGVLGLRLLAPFPGAAVVESLRGRRQVVALEPVEGNGQGMLAAALRAVVSQGLEAGRSLGRGAGRHRRARGDQRRPPAGHQIPPLRDGDLPTIHELRYGAEALAGAELGALLRRLFADGEAPVWLGVAGQGELAERPKRQAARDALVAEYPNLLLLGVGGKGDPLELRPPGAVTVALAAGSGLAGLGGEAARLLHAVAGGHLRGSADGGPAAAAEAIATMTWAPHPLRHPGCDVPAELGLLSLRPYATSLTATEAALLRRLGPGATLLLAGEALPEGAPGLPTPLQEVAVDRSLQLALVTAPAGDESARRRERCLGALLGALALSGRVSVNLRRLLAARRPQLVELDEESRQSLLDALAAGFEAVRPAPFAATSTSTEDVEGGGPIRERVLEVPLAARRLAGAHADSAPGRGSLGDLPHFWEEVVSVHREGQGGLLLPTPTLAAAAEPAGSAALCAVAARMAVLPGFDPAPCTGCGVCWSACPEGAVGAWVISGTELVEHAMTVARTAGGSADALRTVAGRLAEEMTARLGSAGDGCTAGELLGSAAEAVLARSPLPEERKEAVRSAAAVATEALGELPLAVTAPFFADRIAAGETGEALVLAIDPEQCTGCGLCVAECAPRALNGAPASPPRVAAARRQVEIASTLPAPSVATVEQAAAHPEVGSLASALLTAEARGVLWGGGAEAGAGSRMAVRQALGVAAHALQPRRVALVSEVEELGKLLVGEVRGQLSSALPGRDLAALDAVLARVDRPDAGLSELVGRVGDQGSPRVEVARLRRLVAAAREVGELQRGFSGSGEGGARALFSLVVAPGAADQSGLTAWAAAYPANPFTVPTTVAPAGDPVGLARGLARGAAARAVVEARLMRRAHLELEKPGEAAHADLALATLDWSGLTAQERRLTSPVVLIAEESDLAPYLASLLDLLAGDLPVLVLALAPGAPGAGEATGDGALTAQGSVSTGRGSQEVTGPSRVPGRALDLAALARTATPAAVAEVSPGAPEELASAIAEVIGVSGPAYLRLHAPGDEELGIAPAEVLAWARESVARGRFVPSLRQRAPESGAGDEQETAFAGPAEITSARHAEELAALSERHARELEDLRAALGHEAAEREARLRLELAYGVRGRLLALVARPRPAGDREEPS